MGLVGGEARLADTRASRSKQAAQLSQGLLCLLCACGAEGLGFVHGSALFRGWVGDFGGVVHEIRLFHG